MHDTRNVCVYPQIRLRGRSQVLLSFSSETWTGLGSGSRVGVWGGAGRSRVKRSARGVRHLQVDADAAGSQRSFSSNPVGVVLKGT